MPGSVLPQVRVLRGSAVVVWIFFAWAMQAQQAEFGSLRGTIQDEHGKAIPDVVVQLKAEDSSRNLITRTDAQGQYLFAELPGAVYSLRATKGGYRNWEVVSLFLAAKDAKIVDLRLSSAARPDSPQAPQFFDQPKFTVSGVTDTTSLGGHGSDTIVKARDTFAKDTAGLGKSSGASSSDVSARENALRQRVERQPKDLDANRQLGELLLESERSPAALPYLERAAAANPEYEISFMLALANAHAGYYEKARDEARALLAVHDKAEVHHLLGDVQEKLGDSLDAVRQYGTAAELDPSEPNLFDWGSELLLHHAAKPAEEVFANGNRLFPSSSRMLIGLGAAWFAQGEFDQAVQQVCEASDLNPNDPIPYLFLGKLQNAETRPSDQVIEKLHRFVVLQPQNAEANYYYAVSLWKTRKPTHDKTTDSEIEALLSTAIRLDPRLAAAQLQLGILHAEGGDYPKAISDYQEAAQIDPQMVEAHYRLAQAYRQYGESDKAKSELQIYERLAKETNEKLDRERHEIKQFVYTLRDSGPKPAQ